MGASPPKLPPNQSFNLNTPYIYQPEYIESEESFYAKIQSLLTTVGQHDTLRYLKYQKQAIENGPQTASRRALGILIDEHIFLINNKVGLKSAEARMKAQQQKAFEGSLIGKNISATGFNVGIDKVPFYTPLDVFRGIISPDHLTAHPNMLKFLSAFSFQGLRGFEGFGKEGEFSKGLAYGFFRGGQATKGYDFNLGGYSDQVRKLHQQGKLYDKNGEIRKGVLDFTMAKMGPTTAFNPATGRYESTGAIGKFANALNPGLGFGIGFMSNRSIASGKSSKHGNVFGSILSAHRQNALKLYGISPLGQTAQYLTRYIGSTQRAPNRGAGNYKSGVNFAFYPNLNQEFSFLSGEISSLFPLFTDIPQTGQTSFTPFVRSLLELRQFREQISSLIGLSFQNQSQIELNEMRTRAELEDRVRFSQRLEYASGGLTGF